MKACSHHAHGSLKCTLSCIYNIGLHTFLRKMVQLQLRGPQTRRMICKNGVMTPTYFASKSVVEASFLVLNKQALNSIFSQIKNNKSHWSGPSTFKKTNKKKKSMCNGLFLLYFLLEVRWWLGNILNPGFSQKKCSSSIYLFGAIYRAGPYFSVLFYYPYQILIICCTYSPF